VKILVVGSGGREHALAWKLKQSSRADRIFCAPGNAGTAELGENVAIPANDLPGLVHFAKENQIGLTVIGPDDPLEAGIADLFEAEGLRIFGPSKSAARLESAKLFAKVFMRSIKVPTARGAAFSKCEAAFAFVEEARFPLVIKADGLALGKGVIIAQDAAGARVAIDSMMTKRRFGDAGTRLLIEECLTVESRCAYGCASRYQRRNYTAGHAQRMKQRTEVETPVGRSQRDRPPNVGPGPVQISMR
jgi:phosphoribosylamine--glycine ligase